MKTQLTAAAMIFGLAFGTIAMADTTTTATNVQRDVNQQDRIEQGLKSGALTTKEASSLETKETKVEHDQSKALANGNVSAGEEKKLNKEENQVSRDIHADKTNGKVGNPDSASSKRMQADVARNANQQTRIEKGVKSGALTNRETASLEHGQAKTTRREARAGANGHISSTEQAHIRRAENTQSRHIHNKKHNGTTT